MKMNKIAITIAGLFSFSVGEAASKSPEKLAQEGQETFASPRKARPVSAIPKQPVVAPQATVAGIGAAILKPTDALDETKVGIAAKFIVIGPGKFKMGSLSDGKDGSLDKIRHRVKLTEAFGMQATEVTQLQYTLVMGMNPSVRVKNCDDGSYKVLFGLGLCVNHPVENVSWNDTQEFIKKLNGIQDKYTYQLPTDAQWEYAARAGLSGLPYFIGIDNNNELDNYGWFKENSSKLTHAVATKKSNPFGLNDMYGNVEEWTQDFSGDYPTKKAVTDPTGPATGSLRIIRGGSCLEGTDYRGAAFRSEVVPGHRFGNLGFRLVRSPR